jgi:hypothetical protein
MYVYLKTEPTCFTVGHYAPNGEFIPESDHGTRREASDRVHYLNGGKDTE